MKMSKLSKNKKSSSSPTISTGLERATRIGARKLTKSARKTGMVGVSYGPANKNGIRESSEKAFEGITARLVNTKTNKFK